MWIILYTYAFMYNNGTNICLVKYEFISIGLMDTQSQVDSPCETVGHGFLEPAERLMNLFSRFRDYII